ncbi:c-type cytochrome [Litoreibacter halocynthiae]|uniref:c-type cytochrome n=1 Tax=Litoreibacter halocynthiae TaxID=1242689 RepID=UPI0024900BF3|nr:cytochrome c [Litoreibacter halocynthiae]
MRLMAVILVLLMPTAALAQDNGFRLAMPAVLEQSGFMQHIVPRFSLKHGIRITRVADTDFADARLGAEGVPVFAGLGQVWALQHDGHAGAAKFANWLRSEVGRNTIAAYQKDGVALFTSNVAPVVAKVQISFDGDPVQGEKLSFAHCGRCHVINETNRMKGMGATPSFGMLRTLGDWENRFATFYFLNPHPSFTQVADITPAFDPSRPPAIVPVEVTQDEIEAILAYVATLAPADLGAPIQSQ